MEIRYLRSSENFQNLQDLGYLNSCGTKYFQRRSCKKTQRLIPLTTEIEKTMMNFNGSASGTSTPEGVVLNTASMMNLAKGEVYNILQELPRSEQIMHRYEIGDLRKKSLHDCNAKLQHVILHDANDELVITVKDITEDQDKTTLFMESTQRLKHRINKLEKRLKFLLKNITKLRLIQAKQFKFEINGIKDKFDSLNRTNLDIKKESIKNKDDKNKELLTYNIYDELFYKTREYTLNLLTYKKSLESLKLNTHSAWNPYVRPTYNALSTQGNFKKCSIFLKFIK